MPQLPQYKLKQKAQLSLEWADSTTITEIQRPTIVTGNSYSEFLKIFRNLFFLNSREISRSFTKIQIFAFLGIFTRESSYCFQRVLAIAILSVRPSVTRVDQSKSGAS